MAAPKRGNYASGMRRRDRILDAAAAKFATTGYSKTSLAELARDVGLTTPGLTHHFPTKQHLLLAIAERRLDLATELAHSAPPDTDGLGPLRLMLRIAQTFAAQPALVELFVLVAAESADPSSAAHSLYAERYDRVIEELAASFRHGVDHGWLRADVDYEGVARECIALADGLQLQWVLTRGTVDMVGIVRAHLERLAGAITVADEPVEL